MSLSGFQSVNSLGNQVIGGYSSSFASVSALANQAISAGAVGTAPPGAAQTTVAPFTIAGFQLLGTEVPQRLTFLGGEQKTAIHDFPGGVRTIQSLGAFPARLSWSGLLAGTSAFERSYAIDRFRVAGANVEVSYGQWKWSGVILSYHATVQHQWLVNYEIEFMPDADLSSPPVTPTTDDATALLQTTLSQISANVPTTLNGVTFPTALSAPLLSMQVATTQGLLQSNGVISAIPAATVSQVNVYAQQAFAAGNVIIASTATDQSSLALTSSTLRVLSYAGIVQNSLNAQPPTTLVLTLVNPNLYGLAAQYLGDASRWTVIASLNNLNDPMPIGQYTLNIPTTSGLPPVPTGAFN